MRSIHQFIKFRRVVDEQTAEQYPPRISKKPRTMWIPNRKETLELPNQQDGLIVKLRAVPFDTLMERIVNRRQRLFAVFH